MRSEKAEAEPFEGKRSTETDRPKEPVVHYQRIPVVFLFRGNIKSHGIGTATEKKKNLIFRDHPGRLCALQAE